MYWTKVGVFVRLLTFEHELDVFVIAWNSSEYLVLFWVIHQRICVRVCTNTLKLDEPMLCRTFIYHTVEITMNIIASMNGCCVIWQLKIEFSWNFMIRIRSLLSIVLHSLMLVGAFISFVLELKRTNPFVEWANI